MTQLSQIVLFGSGPVASRSLELIAPHFDVTLVVTKRNRGRTPAPVETVANSLGIPIEFADTKKEVTDLVLASKLPKTTCALVVDYGVILEQKVIDYFPLGIVNSHFSLLPLLRGADPISFAILEGHPKTGVSIMKIVDKLDEGDLISCEELEILDTDTTPSLTEKLVDLSARMLIRDLPNYIAGKLHPLPQSGNATYTRKLSKEDGRLDFTKPADRLTREVRAFSGWPKSYSTIGSIDVVITSAMAIPESFGTPGTLKISEDKQSLRITCGVGSLDVLSLIPSGKKVMSAQAFLNGYGNKIGLTN